MRKMSFYNKDKNKNNLNTLANALSSRDKTNINTGNINAPLSQQKQEDNTLSGALQFGKGALNLYNQGKENGWFNFGKGSNEPSLLNMSDYTAATNSGIGGLDNLSFGGNTGNLNNLSFMGSGTGGSIDNLSFTNALGSGTGSGGGFGGGGMPWALIGQAAKTGYNGISGHDDGDYSDLEETFIYPMQGASIGGQYGGGWGALGGALYGLGYSLKDDMGLKDNDWFTNIVYPIGLGDEHEGLLGWLGG